VRRLDRRRGAVRVWDMKATLFAMFVGLLMVGCGGDAEYKIQEARESGATKLDLYRSEISDLSPLKELTNLTWLDLDSNQITDVSPLKGLTNLQGLVLNFNQISDISPLAGLTNLELLELTGNKISDLSPLAGLTNLETLYLMGNPILGDQKAMLKKALPNCEIEF